MFSGDCLKANYYFGLLFSSRYVCDPVFHFVLSAGGYVLGLAVIPEEDKLYISDSPGKRIVVTRLDGSGERTFINCTSFPRGLVVDRNNR